MFGLLNALPGGISQGLMWAVLALGVYVTYKILDFADLTVDGSLATGGCVAIVLTAAEVHPIIALLVATLVGALAGIVTALLNTKLKIPAIVSGILTLVNIILWFVLIFKLNIKMIDAEDSGMSHYVSQSASNARIDKALSMSNDAMSVYSTNKKVNDK